MSTGGWADASFTPGGRAAPVLRATAENVTRMILRNYEQALVGTGASGTPVINYYDPSGTGTIGLGSLSVDNGGLQVGGTYAMSAEDMCNIAPKLAMWDNYRLRKAEFEVIFTTDLGSAQIASSPSGANYPDFWYVNDQDDFAIPPNQNYMRNRASKHAVLMPNKPLRFTIYPKLAQPVFNSGVLPSYGQLSSSTWVDSAYTNVPWYGLKFWLANMPAPAGSVSPANASKVSFNVTYYLEFKGIVG